MPAAMPRSPSLASPPSPVTSSPLSRRDAVLALAGLVLVALALRPSIVSIGPVLAQIQQGFGLSHSAAALLTTIPDVLMGLLALPTPWLAQRFGRDRVIIAALALLAASTALRAVSPNVAVLLLTTAGVGTGIAIAGTLLSGFVKGSFPTRAAAVIGLYSTSLALGSTVSAMGTAPLAQVAGGWRFAVGIWALLGVVAVLSWVVLSSTGRTGAGGRASASVPRAPLPWRDPVAWRVALFFAFDNLLFYAMVAWTAAMFQEHGLSATAAGLLLGCFTASFMVASMVVGSLSRALDRRRWLLGCSVLSVAGLLAIAVAPLAAPMASVALTAFGLGGAFTLAMTLPLDNTRNASETNAWTAFTLTVGYLIAATGPLLVGALRDASGDFHSAMGLLVGVAVAMGVVAVGLKPRLG